MGGLRKLEDFIGEDVGTYQIYPTIEKALLGDTAKDWVFRARDPELGRDVALKVLKPNQPLERIEQFKTEGKTLAQFEKIPGAGQVYAAGKDRGVYYAALELIESPNLKQEKDKGVIFSLKEVVCLMKSVADTLTFAGEKRSKQEPNTKPEKEVNGDIKLANIIRLDKTRPYVVDFAPRLTKDEFSNDIYALAKVGRELFETTAEKIPKGFLKILEKAECGEYKTTAEFKKAIERYETSVSRRKLLKIGAAGALVLGSFYGGYKYLDYLSSITRVVHQIKGTAQEDYASMSSLDKKLKFRLCDQKVRWWLEKEKIKIGESPYATNIDGNWFTDLKGPFWTDGFFRGIIWESFLTTNDTKFRDWASERTEEIKITKADSSFNTAVRFFYSHAKAYDVTRINEHKKTALEALDLLADRFDEAAGLVSLVDGHPEISESGTMMDVVPFLWWGFAVTKNKKYCYIAKEHTLATVKANIREDGSVRKTAILEPKTGEVIAERNSKGVSDESTLSRSQAQMLLGLSEYLKFEESSFVLEKAIKVADYFIENLHNDFIPLFDFQAPQSPETPRDSSAATIMLVALSQLNKFDRKSYSPIYWKIKRSLIANYLSTNLRKYEGIITKGCDDWKKQQYTMNSLIWGDYYFLIG